MAGNITIIPPKENFLKVSKGIIYNDDVDALSLGIYVKVIALGRKWQLNIRGLAKALHLSEDRIRNSFAVLEKAGYLRRFKTHGEHGHFNGWDYEVASDPFTDIANSPTSVKTDIGKNRHRCFDTQNRDDIIENRDDKGENRDIEEKPTPFDFKNALMELGADRHGLAVRAEDQEGQEHLVGLHRHQTGGGKGDCPRVHRRGLHLRLRFQFVDRVQGRIHRQGRNGLPVRATKVQVRF